MTNTKERDAFDLVVERHQLGASENDIRTAFQRFPGNGRASPTIAEQKTEGPPGVGNPGRMDLYVHNTCIEFKTNIVRNGIPIPSRRGPAGQDIWKTCSRPTPAVQNGILTDGVHYFLRRVGEEKLPLIPHGALRTFDRAEQAPRVREYLHGIISAPAENVSPTAENLEAMSSCSSASTAEWSKPPKDGALKEALRNCTSM